MKIIIFLSLLLVSSLGASPRAQMPIDDPDRTAVSDHDRDLIKYYLSGMRGLWAGYMHVFHHGAYALDDKCFKEESAHEVMEILNFLVYGGLSELMLTADAAYALYHDNLKHCGVQDSFQTIHNHCTANPETCTLRKFILNGEKNWMRLVQTVNGLATIVLTYMSRDLELNTDDNIYEIMRSVGESAGNLVTAVFDL